MSGGHDPDIDPGRYRAANVLEGHFLEHPDVLGLDLEVDVADLVQEEGPAVGLLEAAHAVAVGAGERPLDVAEQLALEQVLRECRAMHLDEGARRTGTSGVDGCGQELFAGSALPSDQDRRWAGRDLPGHRDHRPDRRTRALDLIEDGVDRVVLGVFLGQRRGPDPGGSDRPDCTLGPVSKLLLKNQDFAAVARRSFRPCRAARGSKPPAFAGCRPSAAQSRHRAERFRKAISSSSNGIPLRLGPRISKPASWPLRPTALAASPPGRSSRRSRDQAGTCRQRMGEPPRRGLLEPNYQGIVHGQGLLVGRGPVTDHKVKCLFRGLAEIQRSPTRPARPPLPLPAAVCPA